MSNGEPEETYLVSVADTTSGWDKPQAKLRRAFAQNEFILFSQSIIKLAPGGEKRAHFEVFIRLQEEEQHLIPPGSFLPMLEYFNLGPILDRYVLRKLLGAYRSIKPEKRGVAHLNLCGDTLADPDFCAFVQEELRRTETAGELLCFEFPGKEINYPASAVVLAEGLKRIGCQISVGAMEDGEIPFRPIKDMGANFLKLGGRLMQELASNEATVAEVRTAANACRSFDVQTIAQSVEDAPTLNALRKLDITFAQGYGISHPSPLGRMSNAAA